MISVKSIPNLLTLGNLIVGSSGIITVFAGDQEIIFFILVAGIFDFLDGLTAKLLNAQSDIGKQLDSMADLISFGCLPAFAVYREMAGINGFWSFCSLAIIVFSALRLAKFNLDDSQLKEFKGLPSPANALLLASILYIEAVNSPFIWIIIIILSCTLLVAPVTFIAFKFDGWDFNKNIIRYLLILTGLLILVISGLDGLWTVLLLYIV